MAGEVSAEMVVRLSRQYEWLLQRSLAAEWIFDPPQLALLRWATLARYLDLVRLGKAEEARTLLAWRDAERAKARKSIGPKAA